MTSPLIVFGGGRVGDFTLLTGTQADDTGSWEFDPTYSDCSLSLGANAQIKGSFTDAAGAALSITSGQKMDFCGRIFETRFGQIVAGAVVTFYNAAGQPWVRIYSPTNGDIIIQYNSGTGASPAWTSLGSNTTIGLGAVFNVSVGIDAGGAGVHSILFAVNGTSVYTGTFTNAGLTNFAYFVIVNTDPGGGMYLSQIMAARDTGLVGAHLKTIRGTGAGTYSQWTGTVTGVNKAVLNDSTYNVTTTINQLQSYAQTDITLPAQYVIATVLYKMRVRNDGTNSPLNVQALCRSGGNDFLSGNLSPVVNAFGWVNYRYDVDPNTGVAWTQSGVNAMELGFKSIT